MYFSSIELGHRTLHTSVSAPAPRQNIRTPSSHPVQTYAHTERGDDFLTVETHPEVLVPSLTLQPQHKNK